MANLIRAHAVIDLTPSPDHEALLFDWDGTLADSQQLNFSVLHDALALQGVHLDADWFAARTGMSTREMAATAGRAAQLPLDVERVAAERDRAYLERVSEVGEVAAVAALLRMAAPQWRTALATGGGRSTVVATAAALGLLPLFDAIVTREDVTRGKPHPDIFRRAAWLLGVKPARCLVYEDSDEGLAAAEAADMDAVDIRPLRT